MKLKQVYDALGNLHLTSLALSNEGVGILKADYPSVNVAINHTLLDIFTDFDLRLKELMLRVISNRVLYPLEAKYADSSTDPTAFNKWIIDSSSDPFLGDVKYIKGVFNSCGLELPLNNNNVCNGVYTPNTTTLQLSNHIQAENDVLSVIYVANPQEVPVTTDLNPEQVEITLSDNMFNLLVIGTCKHIFQSKSGKDMYYKGLQYEKKYEEEKAKLINLGFLNEAFQENESFSSGGWV